MPVADLLVAQLRKATLTKDTALITEVYDAVCASRRGILDVAQRIAPEVFVLIAETALECNLVPVAAQAVAQYFSMTQSWAFWWVVCCGMNCPVLVSLCLWEYKAQCTGHAELFQKACIPYA